MQRFLRDDKISKVLVVLSVLYHMILQLFGATKKTKYFIGGDSCQAEADYSAFWGKIYLTGISKSGKIVFANANAPSIFCRQTITWPNQPHA